MINIYRCIVLGLLPLIAGCAAALPGYSPDAKVQANLARAEQDAANAGRMNQDGTYALGPDELKLDCKKLTGRMQVRILQIRDQRDRVVGSDAGRAIQKSVQPVFGGTQHGSAPDAEFARDRAIVQAYNQQLASKNCKTFDLDAELQPKPVNATPTPTAKKK
jgi:hypothetical protein